jgi:hypothetical protein
MRRGNSWAWARQILSHPFALAVRRDRFAQICLFLLPPILARSCCSLARKINKFLERGIVFKAGPEEVFRSIGIDFEISFFIDRLGHTCQME